MLGARFRRPEGKLKMQAFNKLTGVAAPLPMVNVDTDMIVPKQFLKTIKRTGLKDALFFDARTKPDGSVNPEFVLNRNAYKDAKIFLAGANFGCHPRSGGGARAWTALDNLARKRRTGRHRGWLLRGQL